jgi:hypothetical protein
MKTLLTALLLGFVTLGLTNCKKSEVDAPDQTATNCKLTIWDKGNGNKEQFEYNAAGNVNKRTLTFREGDRDQVYVYTFKYNNNNQVTGATITVDGKIPEEITDQFTGSSVEFRWTDGKLTEIKDLLSTETIYLTTVSYDAQGRAVRFSCVPTDKQESPFVKTYTYDAEGNFKYEYSENGVKVSYDDILVDNTIKSAESLLAVHGLPIDPFNLFPWKSYVLKGFKSYDIDQLGNTILYKSFVITNVVKNRQNIAVSQTIEEGSTKRVNTFTLADCE